MCIVHVSRYRIYRKDMVKNDIKTVHRGVRRVMMSTYSTATANAGVLITNSEIKTKRTELATF